LGRRRLLLQRQRGVDQSGVEAARGPNGERVLLTHDVCGRVVTRRIERDGFRPQEWRYGWDAFDRLVSCVTPQGARWTYAYDPFGRRVEKRERLAPAPLGAKIAPRVCGTRFVWDGDVLAEEIPIREDDTLDVARRVEWLFEEGGFAALARADAAGVAYVVADHLGTPRELISAQGEMVWAASWRLWGAARKVWRKSARAAGERAGRNWRDDAWRDEEEGGARIGAQAVYADAEPAFEPMPFRFPGQFEDAETGLYYNRHRHYDPLAGGYVSPDPIGLSGGDRPSGYVERPGCWADPLGLAAAVPGRVQSRINLWEGDKSVIRKGGAPKQGFKHVEKEHFAKLDNVSVKPGKSQFSISRKELKDLLQSKSVVQSKVSMDANSGSFIRTVDVGRDIGTLAGNLQGGHTSIITVITDKYGNLLSTFPGGLR
jgi:RHS repeat-associated protein